MAIDNNKLSIIHPTHTLTGGVHLLDNKTQSTASKIERCPIPAQLMLPVNMHNGADAKVIVEIGEKVTKNQIIAEAVGSISANIHSPVDGSVADIKLMPVVNRSELEELVVILDVDRDASVLSIESAIEETIESTQVDWSGASNEELLASIEQAGIVGLGGAGFPTHQKLISSNTHCHTLLLNGAECEPYISCDDILMREQSPEILQGAIILAQILGTKKIQVAIEDNKPEALLSMQEAMQKAMKKAMTEVMKRTNTESVQIPSQTNPQLTFELINIPTQYPSGGEKQLIEIITGQQIAIGKYPASLGYIVQNVATAHAIYDAVVHQQPLIDRIVTVTGKAVSRPGNYQVTLGTSIRHLLDFAGCNETITKTLIHGGPMMGFPLASADLPIVKSSNCIIAATETEIPEAESERPCIRCGQCADVCPASLLPQQLFWFSQSGELNKAEDHNIMDCIECGACAYVCPSQIPLVDYYRFTKGEIKTRAAITEKAERSKVRFDSRNERLENIKLEKARLKAERSRLAAENRAKKHASSDATANGNGNGNGDKKDLVAEALARVETKKKAKAAAQLKAEDLEDKKEPDNQGTNDV